MPDSKEKKLARMAAARPQSPIPEVPKLPEELKIRLPELKEVLDAYDEKWRKFFNR